MTDPLAGLEDVVVTTSTITFIDGEKGILRYRGYDVNELAEKSNYEEVCYLLLHGVLPTEEQLRSFQGELRANRTLPESVFKILLELPAKTEPMAVLRTAGLRARPGSIPMIATTANRPIDAKNPSTHRPTRHLDRGHRPVFAREALPSIPPRICVETRSQRQLPLYADRQEAGCQFQLVRAIDVALILQADHELNASTFAGRVTRLWTLSDLHSGVVTGPSARSKAPAARRSQSSGEVEMLEKIGSVDKVEGFVQEQLKAPTRKLWASATACIRMCGSARGDFKEDVRAAQQDRRAVQVV